MSAWLDRIPRPLKSLTDDELEALADDVGMSSQLTTAQIRNITPAERDAAHICRRCWERYKVCVCQERSVRAAR